MEDKYWHALLNLQEAVTSRHKVPAYCYLRMNGEVVFDALPGLEPSEAGVLILLDRQQRPARIPGSVTVFLLEKKFVARLLQPGQLPEAVQSFLKAYLPYCCLSFWAHTLERAVTVAHFAQSLDGRIATSGGQSKWIGNRENLVHAHRMRALTDAILIGSGTLKRDNPRLTVRHVKGENPVRVILGDSCEDLSSLYESCPKPVMVIGSSVCERNGKVDYVQLPLTGQRIHCLDILRFLYRQGIHSVYLEGGPTTTSNFLQDEAVDILQLHLAPMLFGSGQPAIVLPAIDEVSHAVQFKDYRFQPVGDTVMFVGEVEYGG